VSEGKQEGGSAKYVRLAYGRATLPQHPLHKHEIVIADVLANAELISLLILTLLISTPC
jgi:hypothetical protein